MDLSLSFRSQNSLYTPKLNSNFTCKASTLVSMKKEENFYEILSLKSERVGVDAIKRAYRSMALQYHPDVCPPSKREESTKMFIELQRAYETLSDPIMRRKYDCHLALGELGDEEMEETTRFSKDVWMNQLSELRVRSCMRMMKKRRGCRR